MKLKVAEGIYVDKIYVINLESQVYLRNQIADHLMHFNIYQYSDFFNAIKMPENPTQGCRLSHLGVIQDAKINNYESIMVLEDDCRFTEFPFKLNGKVPDDWLMIYPGYYCLDENSWKENEGFLRLVDGRNTHCYIMKRNLYDFALKFLKPDDVPVDMRMIRFIQTAVPCYGIYPIKAYPIIHQSSIDNNNEVDWKPLMENKAEICFKKRKPNDMHRYQDLKIQKELYNKI